MGSTIAEPVFRLQGFRGDWKLTNKWFPLLSDQCEGAVQRPSITRLRSSYRTPRFMQRRYETFALGRSWCGTHATEQVQVSLFSLCSRGFEYAWTRVQRHKFRLDRSSEVPYGT